MTTALEKTIIALDYPNLDSVMEFVESFDYTKDASPKYVKVGMELYYAVGSGIITYLKN